MNLKEQKDPLPKALIDMRNGNREDQLFYLASLKELGRIWKNHLRVMPNQEGKKTLLTLAKHIEKYDLK